MTIFLNSALTSSGSSANSLLANDSAYSAVQFTNCDPLVIFKNEGAGNSISTCSFSLYS